MTERARFESSAVFFEAKYKDSHDPWDFSSDAYELSRYDAIINAISHKRYHRAFEPGCSIGVLTERLALCCDAVDAIDFSSTAVAEAKARCSHLPQIEVRCAELPDGRQNKSFDLLVLSEIGYYFTLQSWQQIVFSLIDSLPEGATILAAHWLGHSEDHCISGDEVHEIILSHPQVQLEHAERKQRFRLDRLVRL